MSVKPYPFYQLDPNDKIVWPLPYWDAPWRGSSTVPKVKNDHSKICPICKQKVHRASRMPFLVDKENLIRYKVHQKCYNIAGKDYFELRAKISGAAGVKKEKKVEWKWSNFDDIERLWRDSIFTVPRQGKSNLVFPNLGKVACEGAFNITFAKQHDDTLDTFHLSIDKLRQAAQPVQGFKFDSITFDFEATTTKEGVYPWLEQTLEEQPQQPQQNEAQKSNTEEA